MLLKIWRREPFINQLLRIFLMRWHQLLTWDLIWRNVLNQKKNQHHLVIKLCLHDHFDYPCLQNKASDSSCILLHYKQTKKILWVVNMYDQWRKMYECRAPDLNFIHNLNKSLMCSAMCQLISQVKKMDGNDFPGHTLYIWDSYVYPDIPQELSSILEITGWWHVQRSEKHIG